MIHRDSHNSDYTMISNTALRDASLSLVAYRILLFCLTCSDNFQLSINGLAYTLNLNEHRVMDAVKELKQHGYITQRRTTSSDGKITGCVWDVYEVPIVQKNHSVEKPQCGKTTVRENHSVDEPQCGKHAPIRIINNKELSNIKNEQIEERRGKFLNVLLTSSEFDNLVNSFGADETNDLIESLSAYLEEHPRKHYANHFMTLKNWHRRDQARATAIKKKSSDNPFLDMLEGYE